MKKYDLCQGCRMGVAKELLVGCLVCVYLVCWHCLMMPTCTCKSLPPSLSLSLSLSLTFGKSLSYLEGNLTLSQLVNACLCLSVCVCVCVTCI